MTTSQSTERDAVPATTVTSPATTVALPATSLFVAPVRDDALLASINPTQVTEPCSDSSSGPDGTAAMQAEVARLEPLLGQVLAYGGQHGDEFGSYGLIWHSTNDASVFISFTSNLDVHRDALEHLVSIPQELVVCQVAVSGEVAGALSVALVDDLQGRFRSIGVGRRGVDIVLGPGEQELADELIAKYGDAVEVAICPDAPVCTPTVG